MSGPLPTKAYDLSVLGHEAGRIGENADHGWVFGLPRGIATSQWPLDPATGAPLQHGFTLLLPQDYRCHAPEIVGLSFFATSATEDDGGVRGREDFARMIAEPTEALPEEDLWRPYWRQARGVHPRTHRLTDIVGHHYALVLLTADELAGETTQPPDLSALSGRRPDWMTKGGARAFYDLSRVPAPNPLEALATQFKHRADPRPTDRLDANKALRWELRAEDPNAGKKPMEDWHGKGTASGYIDPLDPDNDFEERAWTKGHKANHIGGTMRPVQAVPDVSPFYVEFEEQFGGYNFGGGNAQLDFQLMRFHWACG